MFESFGLRPVLGRLLTETGDRIPGAHPYAVLSYVYWTLRFGQDPKVVGRSFRMGETLYEVIGVVEKPFTGTEPGTMIDVFVPGSVPVKESEEHTSELQSRFDLVCRLLLEKKNKL